QISSDGYEAMFVQGDVLDASKLQSAREKIRQAFGNIEFPVYAAGGNLPGPIVMPDQPFYDLDMDEFQKVVDLNLRGTVLPTTIFCEDMGNTRCGVVINIASMASYRPITRVVGYGAAKAGIVNFTEWLAVEMAKKFGEGVRVNG